MNKRYERGNESVRKPGAVDVLLYENGVLKGVFYGFHNFKKKKFRLYPGDRATGARYGVHDIHEHELKART